MLDSKPSVMVNIKTENSGNDQVRVKRKTLRAVLQQCQRTLELLETTGGVDEDDDVYEKDNADENRRLGEEDEVWNMIFVGFPMWVFCFLGVLAG